MGKFNFRRAFPFLFQTLVCETHLLQAMGYAATCVLILVSALFCETTVYCASIRSSGPGAQPKPKGFGTAKRAIIIGRYLICHRLMQCLSLTSFTWSGNALRLAVPVNSTSVFSVLARPRRRKIGKFSLRLFSIHRKTQLASSLR